MDTPYYVSLSYICQIPPKIIHLDGDENINIEGDEGLESSIPVEKQVNREFTIPITFFILSKYASWTGAFDQSFRENMTRSPQVNSQSSGLGPFASGSNKMLHDI